MSMFNPFLPPAPPPSASSPPSAPVNPFTGTTTSSSSPLPMAPLPPQPTSSTPTFSGGFPATKPLDAAQIASPPPMQAQVPGAIMGAPMNLPAPMPQLAPAILPMNSAADFTDPDIGKTEADLTAEYIALRNQKSEMEAAHKEALEPVRSRMDTIEAKMLARLNAGGVESYRTTAGTAFKKLSTKFSVDDPQAFMAWVEQSGNTQLLKRDVRQEEVRDFFEQNSYLPPGVKVFSEFVVQFRKS